MSELTMVALLLVTLKALGVAPVTVMVTVLPLLPRLCEARVKVAEPEPTLAELDAGGQPMFPANVPYCGEHGLLFALSAVRCTIDGADLSVRCPVDHTVRDAALQTCTACGTRFVLGAASTSALVRRTVGPPPGGAAVA